MASFDRLTVADLVASGFGHLKITCSCHSTSQFAFEGLLDDGLVDPGTFYAELVLRVRCKKCGNKPALVEPAAGSL